MLKILPIFIITSILAYSCSSSKEQKKSTTSEKTADNSNDDLSFEDETPNAKNTSKDDLSNDGESQVVASNDGDDYSDIEDVEDIDLENEKSEQEVAENDGLEQEISGEVAEFDDEFVEGDGSQKRSLSSAVTIGGEISKYKVQKGDTMMLIAFYKYGDYGMWKKIRNLNPGLDPNNLKPGQLIKFEQPEKKFVWSHNGKPYLIKNGDTLGMISKDKYGTPTKWKDLYENNRPMIKNPNLIFAGFTIYYKDGESDFAFNY